MLARESIEFLAALGAAALPPGRLPLPRDDRARPRGARGAARAPELARCAGRARRRAVVPGLASTTCSARRAAGATASPIRARVAREVLRRAAGARRRRARAHAGRGRRARRARDRVRTVVAELARDGRRRAADPAALPPAARDVAARRPAGRPADVIEAETGFHFRRRGDRLVLAMSDPEPRWTLRDDGRRVALRRPPRAARAPLSAGRGRDHRQRVGRALRHDARRASDRRPRRRWRLRRLRLQRARLHAVAGGRPRACRARSLRGESSLDLRPYALERFEAGAVFPEHLVL